MTDRGWRLNAPAPGVEMIALLVVSWLAFVSIPLALGGIGISWDALNHHVYLGWIADHPRFDLDYRAASGQSFQYPYLYWPFFKLFQSGIGGRWAGALLVTINLLAVPPLWLLARLFLPERSWYGTTMRWLAVALAFLSGVILSLFDSTSNDLVASIPLVWSMALALQAWDPQPPRWLAGRNLMLWSGLMAGASVAFKLSNGPLAIVLPLLWMSAPGTFRQRLAHVAWGCAGTLVGMVLLYAPWGWQLWTHYGNPVYPFYEVWFAPLRGWLGWHP